MRRRRREQAVRPARKEPFFLHDAVQHGPPVAVEFARRGASRRILQDSREQAVYFPGGEKGPPVDIFDEFFQRLPLDRMRAGLVGLRRRVRIPGSVETVCAGGFKGQARQATLRLRMPFSPDGVLAIHRPDVVVVARRDQFFHDSYGAGSIFHIYDGPAVRRVDLDRGMYRRGGRAADEQGNAESLLFHFAGDMHHFVERRRNQTRQADHIRPLFAGRVEDALTWSHYAKVLYREAIALQHHADDVFSDVVHVALHRGHDHLAASARKRRGFVSLHERHEVFYGLLHHARRLHHLREKHLAVAEQVAHPVHALHQRAFNDVQGPVRCLSRFLDVAQNMFVESVDQRMLQPGPDGRGAPGIRLGAFCFGGFAYALRYGEQAFGSVGPPVQDRVLYCFAERVRNVVVRDEGARVHDRHIQSGARRMVQEYGVHGPPHRFVPSKRKRNVAYAAAHQGAGAGRLDMRDGIDERAGVSVVLFDSGGYGQNIGIENNVFGREIDALRKQGVTARADFHPPLDGRGLPFFVERHDHHGMSQVADRPGLPQKHFFAFLQTDGIGDALALQAFEAGLEHLEARGIHHDRHAADAGFGGQQVQEPPHDRLAVEHALVHVDVDDVGAARHLFARDFQRGGEILVPDMPQENPGAGHIGALADMQQARGFRFGKRFEPRQPHAPLRFRRLARQGRQDRLPNRFDMRRRGAATAAEYVHHMVFGDSFQDGCRGFRGFVVGPEFVWQAGVRVQADRGIGDMGHFADMPVEVAGPERAVKAHGQRVCMANGNEKRLQRLSRQRTARAVGYGARYDRRKRRARIPFKPGDCVQGRFRVQRVENRFHQQQIGAALAEAPGRLVVCGAQFFERSAPVAGVFDLRRHGQRAIGGPHAPRHQFAFARFANPPVGCFPRQRRRAPVYFEDKMLQSVVGLGRPVRRETVRGQDVCARRQILLVDIGDEVRLRQAQEVDVAPQLPLRVSESFPAKGVFVQSEGLRHCAVGPVHQHNAPAHRLAQPVEALRSAVHVFSVRAISVASRCWFNVYKCMCSTPSACSRSACLQATSRAISKISSSLFPWNSFRNPFGTTVPHLSANPNTREGLWMGMTPGQTGAAMPLCAHSSRNDRKASVSKKSCEIAKSAPASTLRRSTAKRSSGLRSSGCPSG